MSADSEFAAREAAEKITAFREFVHIGQQFYWPQTHRWLHPKRIIPPHGYGSAPEIAAEEELTFFANLTNGAATTCAEAFHIHYTTVALAHHEFPTWHVSGALVHALLRTTVPAEWSVARFKMPFPAIRLIFEKGAFVLEDQSEVIALQAYLVEPGQIVRLPAGITQELSTLDRDLFATPEPRVARHASAIRNSVAKLEQLPPGTRRELILVAWQAPAAPVKYRFTVHHTPFETTLGDVLNSQLIPKAADSGVSYRHREPSDQRRAIVDNIVPLFLNAVLLLTAKPDYIEGGGLARPVRTKGKRILQPLYHPRFLGKKFAYTHGSTADKALPGRKFPPGWRAGHWKDIAYGPDHGFHRHDWIQPYQYGLEQADRDQASSRARAVNGVKSAASPLRRSQHLGNPGDTITLMLTLRKISPTADNRGRQYIFEDSAGNVLTTISNRRLDFKLNLPSTIQATIVRHYYGGKECRTELADCRPGPI